MSEPTGILAPIESCELMEGIAQALTEREGKLVLLAIDSEEEVLLLCGSDHFKAIADALRAKVREITGGES